MVIICYSVVSRSSFESVQHKWLPEHEKYFPGALHSWGVVDRR
jgi:hypothetical protein